MPKYIRTRTDRSNGVQVHLCHPNGQNRILLSQSLSAADRATLLAGPAFDDSGWELWPYLTAGACLYNPVATTRV